MVEKKAIYVKANTSKKKERFCLNCGINISHRTKDVKFCCPACKAIYKQNAEYTKDALPEKPKLKIKPSDFVELPYNSYKTIPEQMAQSRLTKEMPKMTVVSTPKDPTQQVSQIEKFYQRYNQNKEK